MPKKKVTKLSRWLASINACPAAQRELRKARTFDAAWKLLDYSRWVWWLGYVVLNLGWKWDQRYYSHFRLLYMDRDIDVERQVTSAMKHVIYTRVKAKYLKFKG